MALAPRKLRLIPRKKKTRGQTYDGRGNEFMFEPATSWSFTTMPVLPFLWGLPYDAIAKNWIDALRPSSVRVYPHNELKSDGRPWRVTVTLHKESNIIKAIEQEVQVGLRGDIKNGYDLRIRTPSIEKHEI